MQKYDLSEKLKILIINRKSDTSRRKDISERLEKLGLDFSFFEAVDGHAIDAFSVPEYDRKKRLRQFGRDLTVGEIGCILSHRAVYKKIVAEKIPLTLILEDDVHFEPDFPELIQQLLSTQNKWDMVRFLDRKKIYKGTHHILKHLSDKYALTRVQAVPGGAYAYLLTEHAAQSLLRCTEKNFVQIDVVHGRIWETGLNVIAVKPSPVAPDMEIPSTIGDTRFDKQLQIGGLNRILYPFFRFHYKISTSLMIRLKYYLYKQQDQDNWN